MSLGSIVMLDDVGFKSFHTQKEDIGGVAMLDRNSIICLRTSNGFSVSHTFKDGGWLQVGHEAFFGSDIDGIFEF